MVTITDEYVKVQHATRNEQIKWCDIEEIRLINTGSDPFSCDIWLALIGSDSGCIVPYTCPEYMQIYDKVSQYDGFDFNAVILSMSSSESKQFTLWKKQN